MFQDSSCSTSLPKSTDVPLTVVYSSGAGLVTKGNIRQRKDSLSTIEMHVDPVVAFACI